MKMEVFRTKQYHVVIIHDNISVVNGWPENEGVALIARQNGSSLTVDAVPVMGNTIDHPFVDEPILKELSGTHAFRIMDTLIQWIRHHLSWSNPVMTPVDSCYLAEKISSSTNGNTISVTVHDITQWTCWAMVAALLRPNEEVSTKTAWGMDITLEDLGNGVRRYVGKSKSDKVFWQDWQLVIGENFVANSRNGEYLSYAQHLHLGTTTIPVSVKGVISKRDGDAVRIALNEVHSCGTHLSVSQLPEVLR